MKNLKLLVAIGLAIGSALLAKGESRPFMLVTSDDFPALREKAVHPPFDVMIAYAKEMWNVPFKENDFNRMASQLTFNMLLYVLEEDPEARLTYKDQILWVIDQWETYKEKLGGGHESTVYASSAQFNSLLALDLVGPDLGQDERDRAEKLLTQVNDWFLRDQMKSGKRIAWKLAQIGAVTTYYIYMQDEAKIDEWVERYRHHLMDVSMMSDGSWSQCPGYGHARVASSRSAKSNTIDVIQANGYFDFYGNLQMRRLMDWLNAFSLTPFGMVTKFGESGSYNRDLGRSNLFFFMGVYGAKAGAEAAWHLDGTEGPPLNWLNNFLTYVLMPIERPEPKMPVSLLMPHSGAALWGRQGGHQGLSAVLYSLKRESWEEGSFHHANEDVNSIGLHGYGEYLIMNPGTHYNTGYPGHTPAGGRWYEAWMQNVVLVGDETRHASREGGGLVAGLTGGSIEFGQTDSGQALGNGTHRRSLIMVHPKWGGRGYFALLDQVTVARPDDTVSILLQPNTLAGSTVVGMENFVYTAPVDGYVMDESAPPKSVLIFHPSLPEEVRIQTAYKGSPEYGDLEFDTLNAVYQPDADGRVQAMTLIVPSTGAKPYSVVDAVIEEDGFNGVEIAFEGGTEDWLIEADPSREFSYKSIRFQAQGVVYRGEGRFLMINGTSLRDKSGQGLTADQSVHAQFDGNRGTIQCDGANVTFNGTDILGIEINGELVEGLDRGPDWFTVVVPKGRHLLNIVR